MQIQMKHIPVILKYDCRGIITAPSHAKLKVQYPPPPTALLRMRGGTYMLTHVHPFVLPTVNRPYKLNICTVLYCPPFCSVVLFMPPHTLVTDFTRSL
jgi:hypothetical protein